MRRSFFRPCVNRFSPVRLALLGLVLLLAAAASFAAELPPQLAALTVINETLPLAKQLDAIMANSQKLADAGYPREAADLRMRMLDHYPGTLAPVVDEPFTVRALGNFWGIQSGEALKAGRANAVANWGWEAILAWYREAGAYRSMIAAYEKILRDPYQVFRKYELARHRRIIGEMREQVDSVFIEKLTIPRTSLIDPELAVTFQVVNTSLTPRSSGPLTFQVTDDGGQTVATGKFEAIELPAESRRTLTIKPGVTRAGKYKVTVKDAAVSLAGSFAFADMDKPKLLPKGRAVLLAARDAILSDGAVVVAAPWAAQGQAVLFPGRISFPIEVPEDACYYLELSNLMQQAYEPNPWDIWIDGTEHTPSGMHGTGPVNFVHFAVNPVAQGVKNTTLWRMPVYLKQGTHRIDISLSLGQQLDTVTLLPAINDKVAVKQVRCSTLFGMYYPGEKIDLTMTLENKTDQPLTLSGDVLYGAFRHRALGGWNGKANGQLSHTKTFKDEQFAPITIPARGTYDIPITYDPGEMGHFDPTFRLSDGTGLFVGMGASYARVFKPIEGSWRGAIFSCEVRDARQAEFAGRLGIRLGRWGSGDDYYAVANKYGMKNVMILGGGDNRFLPGGRRVGTDSLPSTGALQNYEEWVYQQVLPHKDQVAVVAFFNEPWEGKTYWGYGARGDHYRLVLKYLYRGVKRANPNIQVIATDGNMLEEPGMEQFLDGISTHYAGVSSMTPGYFQKMGKDVWEDEFWFGEGSDDTQVVSEHLLKLMYGYRMINSFIPFWNNFASGSVRPRSRFESRDGKLQYVYLGAGDAKNPPLDSCDVGSVTPMQSAMIHFITDTQFEEVINPQTVPWVFAFKGTYGKKGTNLAVLTSNIGAGKPGDQAREKWMVYRDETQKRAFVPDNNTPDTPGYFSIADRRAVLRAYDIIGNPVGMRRNGRLILPVSSDPVYIEHKGAYADFAQMLRGGATERQRPYQITLHDFTAPLTAKPSLRVTLHNLYPQPMRGMVRVIPPAGMTFAISEVAIPELAPGAETIIEFPIREAQVKASNEYQITVEATAANGDKAALTETLSVATAVYGKVTVDGKLDEWKTIGAVSQYLADRSGPDASYKAIDPFANPANLEEGFLGEFATAWDEENLYYMARVFDPSYEPQISNFKDFDRALFYPYPGDFVYRSAGWAGNNSIAIHPKGLYFNIEGNVKGANDQRDPKDVYDQSDWRYRISSFRNTDYNYVAYDTYYGPELLRTRKDGLAFSQPLPLTTDFMRLNCQVPGNKLSVNFDRKTGVVIYEGMIPWSEMKNVIPAAGTQFTLGWLISKGVRDTLEWNTARSTSVLNGAGFDFQGKWSVETPWGLYKAAP